MHHAVQYKVCTMQYIYSRHHAVQYTVCIMQYCIQYTVYTMQYSVQYAPCSTVYRIQYAPYTIQDAPCIVKIFVKAFLMTVFKSNFVN